MHISTSTIHPAARIGHVHLRVADLERATAFYRDLLGFRVTVDGRAFGLQAVFLAAGDYHHHLGLNTWESEGGAPPPPHHTGLHHLAIRYPTRSDLAVAVRRVLAAGVMLSGASDHGVSVSVYLSDPDGTGLELTWDRPSGEWPHTADGGLEYRVEDVLDIEGLLAES